VYLKAAGQLPAHKLPDGNAPSLQAFSTVGVEPGNGRLGSVLNALRSNSTRLCRTGACRVNKSGTALPIGRRPWSALLLADLPQSG
jgi:hypothetical protein